MRLKSVLYTFAYISGRREYYLSYSIFIFITETESHKQVAQKLGDANLPRPWSRHSTKKDTKAVITSDANDHPRGKGKGDNAKDIDDPKLKDFLQVMQPRVKSKLWGNDTSFVESNDNNGNSQATLNKEIQGTLVANHPILSNSQVEDDGIPPNNPQSDKSHDGLMSDMDYFKSKVTTEWSDSDSSDDENNDSESADEDDKDNHSHASEREETPKSGAQELQVVEGKEDTFQEDAANDKSQVNATEEEGQSSNPEDKKQLSESCRLFVRNLPYTTTYFLKLSYGCMFHICLPTFPIIIFLQNQCLIFYITNIFQ
jgi:multiple RNA-binding domain-containing protein 1